MVMLRGGSGGSVAHVRTKPPPRPRPGAPAEGAALGPIHLCQTRALGRRSGGGVASIKASGGAAMLLDVSQIP